MEFYDAGSTVVVEARYTGVHKQMGKSLDAQVCRLLKMITRVSPSSAGHPSVVQPSSPIIHQWINVVQYGQRRAAVGMFMAQSGHGFVSWFLSWNISPQTSR